MPRQVQPTTNPATTAPARELSTWQQRLLALTALVVGLSIYTWTHLVERPMLHGPNGYVLADPDSYMRWRLVTRALYGDGVRMRWINDDNPPAGRFNEWTSPMTIVGVLGVHAQQLFGVDVNTAAARWSHWIGYTIGAIALLVLTLAAWRVGGWVAAASVALAWPLPAVVIAMTRLGNTDHQSLHLLVFATVISLSLVAHAIKPSKRAAVVIAILAALFNVLGLWSGATEMLPFTALLAAFAVWEVRWADPTRIAAWRAWCITGCLATAAAVAFEFWPAVLPRRVEILSIWHVLLWAGVFGAMEWTRRRPAVKHYALSLAALGIVAIVLAFGLREFDIHQLHVVQDARFAGFTRVIAEFQPYALDLPGAVRQGITDWGFLPLVLVALAVWRPAARLRLSPIERWLLIATVCFFVLTMYQTRWSGYFTTLLVLDVALLLRARLPAHPWIAIVILVIATLPIWNWEIGIARQISRANGDSTLGPYEQTFNLEFASQCMADASADGPPAVLAPWNFGGTLAGMGKVRPVGSQYWSNLDGLFDTFDAYTTADAQRLYELCDKHGVRFILLPDEESLAMAIHDSFVATRGEPPSIDDVTQTAIWQLASDPTIIALRCDKLAAAAPHWRIVDLRNRQRLAMR